VRRASAARLRPRPSRSSSHSAPFAVDPVRTPRASIGTASSPPSKLDSAARELSRREAGAAATQPPAAEVSPRGEGGWAFASGGCASPGRRSGAPSLPCAARRYAPNVFRLVNCLASFAASPGVPRSSGRTARARHPRAVALHRHALDRTSRPQTALVTHLPRVHLARNPANRVHRLHGEPGRTLSRPASTQPHHAARR
jgi:hypothetical protein